MKKVVENSFAVTGFVGKDAEIRQFTTASVARFPLAVSRKEQNGEEYVSSFIYVEAWRESQESCLTAVSPFKNGFDRFFMFNRYIYAYSLFLTNPPCYIILIPIVPL